ncbi:hypothetical protein [Plantactinospora endophytica]|nr:hypothetical protein [Plantactinospora endophytica]
MAPPIGAGSERVSDADAADRETPPHVPANLPSGHPERMPANPFALTALERTLWDDLLAADIDVRTGHPQVDRTADERREQSREPRE